MTGRISMQANDAVALVMAGTPIMQAARETGVAHATILKHLKRRGLVAPVVAKRGRAKKLPEASGPQST